MTQQRKEGGRGGRGGIADRCHQEGEQGSPHSGDEDDGEIRMPQAQSMAQVEARAVGEHHVDEGEFGLHAVCDVEGLFT